MPERIWQQMGVGTIEKGILEIAETYAIICLGKNDERCSQGTQNPTRCELVGFSFAQMDINFVLPTGIIHHRQTVCQIYVKI